MNSFISNEVLERLVLEARVVPDIGGEMGIAEPISRNTDFHEVGSAAVNFAALQFMNMTRGIPKKERQRYF